MILLLSIVGALAVLSFLVFLGLGLARGWEDPAARDCCGSRAGSASCAP